MRVGAHSDHYCVLGARTGTERRSGMGRAGDGTCVSRGVCGFRDLRTVRWPAVGAVAPGWDAAGSGEGAAERVFRAVAHRPAMAATVSSLLRSRWAARSIRQRVRCAAGVSPTVARKRRASVARENPVAAAATQRSTSVTCAPTTWDPRVSYVPSCPRWNTMPRGGRQRPRPGRARADGPRIPRLRAWRQPAGSSCRGTEATVRSG